MSKRQRRALESNCRKPPLHLFFLDFPCEAPMTSGWRVGPHWDKLLTQVLSIRMNIHGAEC